jgi:hypothetical protein
MVALSTALNKSMQLMVLMGFGLDSNRVDIGQL